VIVFPSIHDVMAFEKRLKQEEIACDLVPVPRDLSSECGMAIEVSEDDLLSAIRAQREPDNKPTGVFRRTDEGFRPVSL